MNAKKKFHDAVSKKRMAMHSTLYNPKIFQTRADRKPPKEKPAFNDTPTQVLNPYILQGKITDKKPRNELKTIRAK